MHTLSAVLLGTVNDIVTPEVHLLLLSDRRHTAYSLLCTNHKDENECLGPQTIVVVTSSSNNMKITDFLCSMFLPLHRHNLNILSIFRKFTK